MTTLRNPELTRSALLQSAFNEIRRVGFQAASLDNILAETGLTKGALYHHFSNKMELGYAVVDELIMQEIAERWINPLISTTTPLDTIRAVVQQASECLNDHDILYGCPLNNLAQEMSSVDEGFRLHLNRIYTLWLGEIAKALRRGQEAGHVRKNLNPEHCAGFIVAALEGCLGISKTARTVDVLKTCASGLLDYLDTLRA